MATNGVHQEEENISNTGGNHYITGTMPINVAYIHVHACKVRISFAHCQSNCHTSLNGKDQVQFDLDSAAVYTSMYIYTYCIILCTLKFFSTCIVSIYCLC